MSMTCGEATIRLLADYGVDTVFGIPGVHTLDFCRGLGPDSPVRHIQARNEQGAGFMADGYARLSGRPGVALVISGPGVTNAATPLGQSYADSVPVLLLSAEASSETIGKGWGVLHEITEQKAVTAPLTALSATARRPEDVPELMRQAFAIFAAERPRPVHISVPIDVQARIVDGDWRAVAPPSRPQPDPEAIARAAEILGAAERPMIVAGGGAAGASREIRALIERLGAVALSSTAGKGVVDDAHPLNLGAATVREEARRVLAEADAVLAIGAELAETDSFVERLEINGRLIRVDIDARKINDFYPADVGVVSDARPAAAALLAALGDRTARADRTQRAARVAQARAEIGAALSESESQHARLLAALREVAPAETAFMGDICQLVYTGAFAMPVAAPRLWSYPAGYCTLGCGLPNAIGAKVAEPDRPVICLAGDGGFMFTPQELICAAELALPIPIILWENGGLKQIQDDMRARQIPLVGVEGVNPDFAILARACRCDAAEPESIPAFKEAVSGALAADRPTMIVVREDSDWLR